MLIPVILSGGTGTRLWPISREAHPKPFMKLPEGDSLLQRTFLRATNLINVTDILTITNRDYYFKTKDEYADTKIATQEIKTTFLLEPSPRNTAPAIALATLKIAATYGEESIMLIMAADHLIEDQTIFSHAVQQAYQLAQQDFLITFGIMPNRPETGYGYIECGTAYEAGSYQVQQFVEKPTLDLAIEYIKSKKYLWNSGLFCFKAKSILEQLKLNAPSIYESALICWEKTQQNNQNNGAMIEIDQHTFTHLENISIDYAVMEKAKNVLVIPGHFGWNDIGCWSAVSKLVEPDERGNSVIGDTVLVDVDNTYIHSEDRLVAAMGINNIFIIDTPDALLVAHRDYAQDVKKVVTELKAIEHESYKLHRTVTRPWGTYTILEEGKNFKIKRIVVKPGAKLSLQMHRHRSEHWVVVSGTAKIVNGDHHFTLNTNESTFIPATNQHRLENPDSVDLIIIEVQSGNYLGEDDIVRFDDHYGRNKMTKHLSSNTTMDHVE